MYHVREKGNDLESKNRAGNVNSAKYESKGVEIQEARLGGVVDAWNGCWRDICRKGGVDE
jgi:hypothetical protein